MGILIKRRKGGRASRQGTPNSPPRRHGPARPDRRLAGWLLRAMDALLAAVRHLCRPTEKNKMRE